MDATDQAFESQRAFIRRCTDVRELLDRMAEYRDTCRAAIRVGDVKTRLRATDLLELAENRVTQIKAERARARERHGAGAGRETPSRPAHTRARAPQPEPDEGAQARLHGTDAELAEARSLRQQRERERAAAETRAAALGEAERHLGSLNAELAELRAANQRVEQELRAARERAARAEEAERQAQKMRTQLAEEQAQWKRLDRERAAAEELAAAREKAASTRQEELRRVVTEAQTARESQAARTDPGLPAPSPPSPTPAPDGCAPRDAPVAAPMEPLSESAEAPTSTRRPRNAGQGKGPAAQGDKPSPGSVVVYTGADLLRLRTSRGLTQRAVAEQLGVAAGTISKAERTPAKALGRVLQAGMKQLLDEKKP